MINSPLARINCSDSVALVYMSIVSYTLRKDNGDGFLQYCADSHSGNFR